MATPDVDPAAGRSLRAALVLGVASLAAMASVVLLYDATRGTIAANRHAREVAQLEAVLGGEAHDNDPLADVTYVRDPDLLGTTAAVPVYRVRRDGRTVAVVIEPVAPDGYAGSIVLRVAVRADGRVLGVRALRHRETPGLGDAIDERKSGWIMRFAGRSLGDPAPERWKVRRDGGDFDEFTGATVTPRAVVRAVASCLEYFRQHRDALLDGADTMPR